MPGTTSTAHPSFLMTSSTNPSELARETQNLYSADRISIVIAVASIPSDQSWKTSGELGISKSMEM